MHLAWSCSFYFVFWYLVQQNLLYIAVLSSEVYDLRILNEAGDKKLTEIRTEAVECRTIRDKDIAQFETKAYFCTFLLWSSEMPCLHLKWIRRNVLLANKIRKLLQVFCTFAFLVLFHICSKAYNFYKAFYKYSLPLSFVFSLCLYSW